MTIPKRNYLLSGVISFFSCCTLVSAQAPAADSAIRAAAIANTIGQYHHFMAVPAALYNGPEYKEYYHTIQQGHPFFASVDFVSGVIMYDNIRYENVPLKFDLVKNEILTKDPSGIFSVGLFHDKIAFFTIHGHTHIRIVEDDSKRSLPTGFYDLLYNGHTASLLKKEYKTLQSKVTQIEGLWNYIEYKNDFFVRKGNEYYHVDTQRGLLNALKDKKPELQQYIRSNRLKFKKDEVEKSLLSIVAYYNTLK